MLGNEDASLRAPSFLALTLCTEKSKVWSMTDEIVIKPGLLADHGWMFEVTFSGRHHNVQCSQKYWKRMTHGEIPPMDLIRLGLEMAQERKITDSLPTKFSLELLADRIHDFEKRIRRQAQTEAAGSPR